MTSKEWRQLALILAVHAVVGAVVLRYGTDTQDEGLLYAWGRRILNGELPYTDFYLVQGVGTFYVQAALMKLFGLSFLVGRVFKQLEALLLICLSFALVRQATGNVRAGLVAAFAAATFSAAHHYRMPWYSTDACLCVVTAAYFACRAIQSQKLGYLFGAGAALGGAMLFKHNHGVFGVLSIGAVLILHVWLTLPASGSARFTRSLASLSVLGAGILTIVGGYVVYYAQAGGSVRLMWLNAFVWAREAKEFSSSFEMAIYPLKIFALLHKSGWQLPVCAFLFLVGLTLSLSRRLPTAVRWAGLGLMACSALFGPDVFVRVYILCFVNLLLFAILVMAAAEALASRGSDRDRTSVAFSCLLVALVGAANAYGGTIPGGGWGRMVETWTGSLAALGVGAYLLCWYDGVVAAWWTRNVWVPPQRFGTALGIASVVISAGLLAKNQAFRPALDVPLTQMTGETQSPGWRGLRGDPTFVKETDEVISSVRALTAKERARLFVYPLNCAIYPLADASNVTGFDVLQVDFLAPSQVPRVVAELNKNPPAAIVYQRKPNASFSPESEDTDGWVRPPMPDLVRAFLRDGYRKVRTWNYYELWLQSPPHASQHGSPSAGSSRASLAFGIVAVRP